MTDGLFSNIPSAIYQKGTLSTAAVGLLCFCTDTPNKKHKLLRSSSKDNFTSESTRYSYHGHLIPIVSDSDQVPQAVPLASFPALSDTAIHL